MTIKSKVETEFSHYETYSALIKKIPIVNIHFAKIESTEEFFTHFVRVVKGYHFKKKSI
ncbi:MAG: hypothetical protein AB7V56_10690 [Candidatus Nitrosocosmicus sp.]